MLGKRVLKRGISVLVIAVMLLSSFVNVFAYDEMGQVQQNVSQYSTGYAFGLEYGEEIQSNIDSLYLAIDDVDVTIEELVEHAIKSAALYEEIVPEKIEWIKGVAVSTDIYYDDLLVFIF